MTCVTKQDSEFFQRTIIQKGKKGRERDGATKIKILNLKQQWETINLQLFD